MYELDDQQQTALEKALTGQGNSPQYLALRAWIADYRARYLNLSYRVDQHTSTRLAYHSMAAAADELLHELDALTDHTPENQLKGITA